MSARMLMALLAMISIDHSFGQFRKFKSKTKFDTKTTPSSPSNPSQAPSANLDSFGRATGIKGVIKGNPDNKFVNLNPETAFGPEVITSFDFPSASILDLTKYMQKLTGINIILDKDIKGKVSIMAPSPITVGDAWKAYLTALNMNGYTLVRSGAFYKIVSARDVRYTPTNIYTGTFTPNTENYIMRIIPLKHINGTEISRSFRPFMSRYGRLIDIKQTNTIIVHDTGSNINRLLKLIKFLDVPGYDESLHIIKLKHSSAQEIAKLLDTILKAKGSSKFRSSSKSKKQGKNISKIIAEPRTNSIIAMASADGAKELQKLINKLDTPFASKKGGGRIHVYYLNYGNAEELAKTLSSLISGAQATSRRSSSRTSRRSSRSGRTEASGLFNSDVKVTADKDNNALIVTATPTDWATLQNVISKLDIPRDQVYVEGIIMETNISNTNEFGISLIGAYGSGAGQRAGTLVKGSDLPNLISGNFQDISGLFVGGGAGKTVSFTPATGGSAISINTITGLISAIASNNNTNILATPQILVLDNKEATFEVGETVPIPKLNTTTSGNTSTSIEFQDITLSLTITPTINKVTRFIKLDIDQKVEEFSNRDVQGVGGAATLKRAAKTIIVVRDQDTVAMGGLMRDRVEDKISKVPLLGDIPVLGWLFKRKSKTREKVNMLFFLTPKIIAPYEKLNAENVKDVLNRRAAHLQNNIKDKENTALMKGLYMRAKRQQEGPLYDAGDAKAWQERNQDFTEASPPPQAVPNYQRIVENVEAVQRGEKIEDILASENKNTAPVAPSQNAKAPNGQNNQAAQTGQTSTQEGKKSSTPNSDDQLEPLDVKENAAEALTSESEVTEPAQTGETKAQN